MEKIIKEIERLTENLEQIKRELEQKKAEVKELEERAILFSGAIEGMNLANSLVDAENVPQEI